MLKNDTVSLPPAPLLWVCVIPGQTPASSLSFSTMTNAPVPVPRCLITLPADAASRWPLSWRRAPLGTICAPACLPWTHVSQTRPRSGLVLDPEPGL